MYKDSVSFEQSLKRFKIFVLLEILYPGISVHVY